MASYIYPLYPPIDSRMGFIRLSSDDLHSFRESKDCTDSASFLGYAAGFRYALIEDCGADNDHITILTSFTFFTGLVFCRGSMLQHNKSMLQIY